MSPTCNQRTTTDTARDLPLDHQATENARFTVKQPEPQEKREIYGRQTDGRETREIYHGTTRPRNTREICRGTTRQTQQRRKRFETTAFSDSAFRFICSRFGACVGPGRGSFTWGNARKMSNLHGGSCFGVLFLGPLGSCFCFTLKRAEHT